MSDFSSLDPETRCYALVGQYLRRWAEMESAMHLCIQTAFKLSQTITDILCANLSLHEKRNILRTAVSISSIPADETKHKYDRALRRIGDLAGRRNMIAHTAFRADTSGKGVEFSHIKAKGEYDATGIVWLPAAFEREGKHICIFRDRLTTLNADLKTHPINDEKFRLALARALLNPRAPLEGATFDLLPQDIGRPTSRPLQPGLFRLQGPPIRGHLDSDSTHPDTNPQTPATPPKDTSDGQ